jgi:hypothetical protein
MSEYALPSFKKCRTITFRAPVTHFCAPSPHIFLIAMAGCLDQFQLSTSRWNVRYNLGGPAVLGRVRIGRHLIIAQNKHVLFILTLDGYLRTKLSAVRGYIDDFAIVAETPAFLELVVVERIAQAFSCDSLLPCATDNNDVAPHNKPKWIARLVRLVWRSTDASDNAVETQGRPFYLDDFHGLITVPLQHRPDTNPMVWIYSPSHVQHLTRAQFS